MEIIPSAKVSRGEGKEKMFKLLGKYEKSNLSIKAFCAGNNIAPATFHYWKKKHNCGPASQYKPSGLQPFIYQCRRLPGYLLTKCQWD